MMFVISEPTRPSGASGGTTPSSPSGQTARTVAQGTRHRLDGQLADVRRQVTAMVCAAEEMLTRSLEALLYGRVELVQVVIDSDDQVDRLNEAIENDCLRMLALQQPIVASDLRFIGTALKVVDDIERIGDHAVNIARTVERMVSDGVTYRPLADIGALAHLVQVMLKATGDAYNAPDATAAAHRVVKDDEPVDQLYHRIRHDLQERMQQEPESALLASYLLFVAHYLERIGDHCVGVAERIIYLETGKEVRT